MKHYNLKITGKVQGVFFRAHAKAKADQFNIHGFVRNEEDGSVYIECEGDEDALTEFIRWCNKGPDQARVDHVEKEEGKDKAYISFKIEKE